MKNLLLIAGVVLTMGTAGFVMAGGTGLFCVVGCGCPFSANATAGNGCGCGGTIIVK